MSRHALLWTMGVLCHNIIRCSAELLVREDLREITTGAASPLDPGALELIRHGAQHSEPESIYLYAMLKFYGHGVQQDTQEAVQLLNQAADLGHRDAEFALGVLYGRGDGGLPRNDRMSAVWLSASANRGHVDAKWMLAILYNEGRGTSGNVDRAVELLQEAVDKQNARACIHLALMYEYGRGVVQDHMHAAQLYEQALGWSSHRREVSDALYYLAILHASGRGVPKNSQRAKELLHEAAELGNNALAMQHLGEMYANGLMGESIDYSQALFWWKQAAAANDPRVSGQAQKAVEELTLLFNRVEARMLDQEQELGVPIRVKIGSIEGS